MKLYWIWKKILLAEDAENQLRISYYTKIF